MADVAVADLGLLSPTRRAGSSASRCVAGGFASCGVGACTVFMADPVLFGVVWSSLLLVSQSVGNTHRAAGRLRASHSFCGSGLFSCGDGPTLHG